MSLLRLLGLEQDNGGKVTLHPLTDNTVFQLMFLKEHIDYFRISYNDSISKQRDYVSFLLKASQNRLQCEIRLSGKVVGFILVAGQDNRLVGGLYPEFKRMGIYSKARNAVIRLLNLNGIFNITYSVDKSNKAMLAFSRKQYKTRLADRLSVTHHNPFKPEASIDSSVKLGNGFREYSGPLYHLSFNSNLKELIPRLPEGTELGVSGDYPEPNIPRVSLSPSPELCFRAIYPNISKLLEEDKPENISFTLYRAIKVKPRDLHYPKELIAENWIHDANITLEHFVTKPVTLSKVGKVTFQNTSNDSGLMYQPFLKGKPRYHSPLEIISDY